MKPNTRKKYRIGKIRCNHFIFFYGEDNQQLEQIVKNYNWTFFFARNFSI